MDKMGLSASLSARLSLQWSPICPCLHWCISLTTGTYTPHSPVRCHSGQFLTSSERVEDGNAHIKGGSVGGGAETSTS